MSLSWLVASAPAAPAGLRVLTQNNYLPGLPALVRVEGYAPDGSRDRETWDIDATLTADGGVMLSTNRITLHNGMGSLLVTFTGGADFNLTATVGGVAAVRALRSVAGQPVTKVGGTLSGGSSTWSGIINLTNDLTIVNHTLTIQSNTLVLINGVGSGTSAADIFVNANGSIQSLGTELHPVTITCSNLFMTNRWGQIRHNASQPSLYRHTTITRAGRAPGEGHTGQAPIIRADGCTLTFESSSITDHVVTEPTAPGFGTPGKAMLGNNSDLTFKDCLMARVRSGPEIQGTALLFTNSYILETRGPDDSDGIYLHDQQPGQTIKLTHSVFGLGDDDGIDTLGSTILVENCILRDWASLIEDAKAISVFGGVTDVRHCLITDSTVAISAKTGAGSSVTVHLNSSTLMGNGTNVLAQFKANAPGPLVDFRITNCVLWGGNPVHSDFAATNFTIRYSDVGETWAGLGNINADPLFVNAAAKNFRVQSGSPVINAGHPASPPDADGTVADLGFFPFLTTANPLIAFGANWRYLDHGTDQGTDWSARLFNDGSWLNGPAQLGYGDGDETTTVEDNATPGYNPGDTNRYLTTYFRRAFTVLNPAEFTNLVATLIYDDGAVVYLNGVEAFRINLPAGPVGYQTPASGPVEGPVAINSISPSLLIAGTNVLAVEMHQVLSSSTDISLDLELIGQSGQQPQGPFAPVVNITAPVDGTGFITPASIAIAVSATDSDGTVASVQFFQNGSLLWTTNAAPYTYAWNNAAIGSYILTAVAMDNSGLSSTSTPVSVTVSVPNSAVTNNFIVFGSAWRYLDNGTDQGTAWTANAFNAASWASGPAQLGYGEGDEATPVGFGPEPGNRYITTYFRRAFSVTNAAVFTNLSLRLLRDDAGVVYLNGAEIFRSPNLPVGAITYLTTSQNPNGENTIDTASFPTGGLLLEGPNTLAVEIHQATPTSSDLSFDFELTGIRPDETNARPIVFITGPLNGTVFGTPASYTLTTSAIDPDGTVANVAFFSNGSLLGNDSSSPFSFNVNGPAAGSYALVAVGTDNVGQSTTSSVVNITVSTNIAPPVVAGKIPAPGAVTVLTNLVITFSKPVAGVNASDLLINGLPASGVSGSGSNYTFIFAPPSFGVVAITWATGHGLADLFTPPHAFDTNSPGANWQYQFLDAVPPTLISITPLPGSTVAALTSISVTFSEAVTGVNASDLLVNALPTTSVAGSGAGPYAFSFAQPALGVVNVSWAGGHGIADPSGNPFAPTPWSYTLDTNSSGVVISEIMFHPSSENVLEEYIELFNQGAGQVSLNGWQFTKGISFTFSNTALPAGGYLVVAANVAAFTNKYPGVTNVVGGWTGFLNNDSEDIQLDDAGGGRVDSVTYADEGDWAVRQRGINNQGYRGWTWYAPHDGLGSSVELINPALANNRGQNWGASTNVQGTPGRANSVARPNTAPFILALTHFPAIPRSTDPVVISARLVDDTPGGLTVNLKYRVDAAAPPAFSTLSMHDDGLNGDAVANDGLYGARLAAQAGGTIIEFYVEASDAQANTRTWPGAVIGSLDGGVGPTGQVANALFQVDDGVATGTAPLYKMILTTAEYNELGSLFSGAPGSDAAMNMTFISIDGAETLVRYLTSVRNRGNGSRFGTPHNYRAGFRSDDIWKGQASLNLNARVPYAQTFGSILAQKSGVDGASSRAVQLRVNGGAGPGGVPVYNHYAANEDLGGIWAGNHFPENSGGNVYKVQRNIQPPNFEYRGPTPGAYQNTYFKESNASENDWTDLIAMLEVMGENRTNLYTMERARGVINVEQWLRHLAVMNLMGNGESGLNTGNNDDYFMYRGVNDPRFLLIYHDLDQVMGEGGSQAFNVDIFRATCCPVSGDSEGAWRALNWFLHQPEVEALYYRTLQDLLDTTFSQPEFDGLIDHTLGSYVPTTTIANMKAWMSARRAYVQGVITGLVPPATNSPVATITGEPRSPSPSRTATLTVGGSSITSYSYRLNGGTWSASTSVGTPITLSDLPQGGTNIVYVVGQNSGGIYQGTNTPTVSLVWVVNTNTPTVRLNEVLASNNGAVTHVGTTPDTLEFYNDGVVSVNLGGLRLTDDKDVPGKFTFPSTVLAAGAHLVVYANNNDGTGGLHTGFTLDPDGDQVYLFDRATNGDLMLDAVKFGRQITDLSIGRVGAGGTWALTTPTFGSVNTAQALGNETGLKINEWLALSTTVSDFVELYNPSALPVALGGLYLTDTPIGAPALSRIHGLSFLGANGFAAFIADGDGGKASHANFQLASEQGQIGLLLATLKAIDCIAYGPQQPDLSQGKCPNGGTTYATLDVPTPGAPNSCQIIAPGGAVLINEVLADNRSFPEPDGSLPDWIEIYNPTGTNVDLGDMSLTDDTLVSRRWVFPGNTVITSLGFLKVRCNADLPASATNTGFGLKANGASVFLFNRLADGGSLLSSVTYGLQAADFSIGRLPNGGNNWTLNIPTLGGNNLIAAMGDPALLKINEWMANPASGEDYFEIYNPNPQPVDLSRFYLTDDLASRTKHQLPALSFLGVGEDAFQRFDADNNTFAGADHVNFKLAAGGEALGLTSSNNVALDSVSFGPQGADVSQGRLPDGAAAVVNFPITPTPGKSNFLPLDNVVVNEVLAHTDPPFEDAIEFYNPSPTNVNIGGWYLSDSQDNLLKYRVPAGTIIPAGGYAVLYEYQFNPEAGALSFSFSSAKGDDVYLSQSTNAGAVTGYRAFATFEASENGVSFGRYLTSAGADFTAMSAHTFGQDNPVTTNQFRLGTGLTNAYPKVGPVVINEIMYHPVSTNEVYEFVELRNITAAAVPLYDVSNPANTWRLRQGVDFNFLTGTAIPAGGYLVLVSFDPVASPGSLALFQTAYGTNLTLAGPYTGKLDNTGEALELQKTDAPQTVPGPDFGFVPYVAVDRVVYGDTVPWPVSPDGTGDALKKVTSGLYGNEPLNWQGGAPTPGAANFPGPADADGDGLPDAWEIQYGLNPNNPADANLDSDSDGATNLQEYLAGTNPTQAGSVLRLASIETTGLTSARLSFVAVSNRTYAVEYKNALSNPSWTTVTNIAAAPTNRTLVINSPVPSTNRFYRVRTP